MSKACTSALLLVSLLGCRGATETEHTSDECQGPADCDEGQGCREGECVDLCSRHTDCSPSEICDDGFCQPGDTECDSADDCPPILGEACIIPDKGECVGGVCIYEPEPESTTCDDADPCTAGDHCDGEGLCTASVQLCTGSFGAPCSAPVECQSGLCESGRCCTAGLDCCDADDECSSIYRCNLDSLTCRVSCGDDAHCKASLHCEGVVCEADLALGEECDEASDCQSDTCESQVCCPPGGDCCASDDDCGGEATCDTLTGLCRTDCASGGDADCKPTGFCDALDLCVSDLDTGDTCDRDGQCAVGRCDDTQCCPLGVDCCIGDADCLGNYACELASSICHAACTCDGDCSDSGECKTGISCNEPSCGVGLPNGDACPTGNSDCASGICDAGYCCAAGKECCDEDSDCPGQDTCDVAAKVCRTSCSGDGQCKTGGWCDSANDTCTGDRANGALCDRAEQCTAERCESGVCCPGNADCCADNDAHCDGEYACNLATNTCNTSCSSLDTGCKTSGWCNGSTCVEVYAQGLSCNGAHQCGTGFCSDQRCCDNSCSGTCKRCDLTGALGTCTNTPSTQDYDNECAATTCRTGNCSGSGSCGIAGFGEDPGDLCPTVGDCKPGYCNSNGACYIPVGEECNDGRCGSTCTSTGSCADNCPGTQVCCVCASQYYPYTVEEFCVGSMALCINACGG